MHIYWDCAASLFAGANEPNGSFKSKIVTVLRPIIKKQSKWAMKQKPLTVTAYPAVRSSGGIHDFYSKATIGGQIQWMRVPLCPKGWYE
ncbi:hypothetical protein KUH03_04455 [Sphingobacterium sp. E70]|uniref:hypothetical protein n=1 Tax=Sphingobacterium sp. E70 TaxID=2853439 RepID=UPI00211C9661|nr:hypothetical protein [Sphingobacterium sp. E70]ULT26190.1 hypothetical protein KUH03_04455 [Sphingobacterium sp. E70]